MRDREREERRDEGKRKGRNAPEASSASLRRNTLQRAGSILCNVKTDAEYEIGPPAQDNS